MTAKVFEAALGIAAPWSVATVNFDEAAKLLTVLIDFTPGSRFALSGHEGVHPVHDTVTKTYRHLSFFQHECHLQVRTPRVKLPNGSVRLIEPDFAGRLSGFTLLFEAMILMLAQQMPFAAVSVDVDGAIRKAIDSRTDVKLARNSIEKSDINLKYFRSQVLPEINANVAYQANAVGGSQLTPVSFTGSTSDQVRAIIAQRSYGSVLGDVFSNQYPTWTVGVSVSYPLGGNTQQTNLARAKLQYSQAEQQLKNLEMQIGTQVRDAARQVTTNAKRVDSARVARDLAEQKLAAEEKKFAAGIQISFFVFQAQRDLAQARTNEIKAIADYNKSVVDFEAIQETSLTGNAQITSAAQGTR